MDEWERKNEHEYRPYLTLAFCFRGSTDTPTTARTNKQTNREKKINRNITTTKLILKIQTKDEGIEHVIIKIRKLVLSSFEVYLNDRNKQSITMETKSFFLFRRRERQQQTKKCDVIWNVMKWHALAETKHFNRTGSEKLRLHSLL